MPTAHAPRPHPRRQSLTIAPLAIRTGMRAGPRARRTGAATTSTRAAPRRRRPPARAPPWTAASPSRTGTRHGRQRRRSTAASMRARAVSEAGSLRVQVRGNQAARGHVCPVTEGVWLHSVVGTRDFQFVALVALSDSRDVHREQFCDRSIPAFGHRKALPAHGMPLFLFSPPASGPQCSPAGRSSSHASLPLELHGRLS